MSLFTSSREKRLWLLTLAVLAAIIASLFFGRPLAALLANQDIQAVFFLLGMLLIGIAILLHAIKTKATKTETAVVLGVAAVYMMFFLRLGLAERTHLMEYSVLAILVHKAITERLNQGKKIRFPALIALIATFLVGVLDECIQLFLPDRVFDPEDILFNGFVISMTIGFAVLLKWIRQKRGKD